jgi:hypothetical protein
MQREVIRCGAHRIAVSESRLEFPGQDHKFYDARRGGKLGSTMHEASTFLARSARVAAICCIEVFPSPADAQVPSINIQETCRAAAAVMVNLMGGSTSQNDVQICIETENKARQQLLKEWSTYQASDREGCIQANVYLPSYVEWLTCFEMNKSVREARRQGRAMSGIVNPDGSVTLPPVSGLGIMGTSPSRSYAQGKYDAPRPVGGTVRSAAVKAAETAWNKLPPNEFACTDQKLTARGDSIQSLARRGVLPSDARVSGVRAQCLNASSPAPSSSPLVAQGVQQPPQPPQPPQQAGPQAIAQASQQPQQQQPSSENQATEMKQTVEKLQTDLAASAARVAALERGKAAAENAVKQSQQARSNAEKAQREAENARNADQARLEEVTAQFEAYKAGADARINWHWAYAGIAGLVGLIAGFAAFPFVRRRKAVP